MAFSSSRSRLKGSTPLNSGQVWAKGREGQYIRREFPFLPSPKICGGRGEKPSLRMPKYTKGEERPLGSLFGLDWHALDAIWTYYSQAKNGHFPPVHYTLLALLACLTLTAGPGLIFPVHHFRTTLKSSKTIWKSGFARS